MSIKLLAQIYDLPEIPAPEKAILAYLAFTASENGETIAPWNNIAVATGYGRWRVQQIMQQLRREGYLTWLPDRIQLHLNEHGQVEKRQS